MTAFNEYIYVEHSLRRPTSITVAAFTGASWRFIQIPKAVLQRDAEAQSGWVSWRVRKHFRESNGECLLFGSITGYRWQRTREDCVLLDTRGCVTKTKHESFTPPSGSIMVGNKTATVRPRGAWQVATIATR